MEEHIETITHREDIVNANVMLVALFVALALALALALTLAAALFFEPVGLPIARTMARRWGDACGCDDKCKASTLGGFMGWRG